MFRNYCKIAFRNLWRNKAFSAINILGLTLGIATCLVIALFVRNELSYDRFNKKADRIVRVTFHGKMNGGEMKEAHVMPPVAQTFKKDFPEVLEATRINEAGTPHISYGDKTTMEDGVAFVDSNFFNVFTIPLIKGDANTALLEPNTIVISRSIAKKFFGNEDPIGKVLEFRDQHTAMTVTGEFEEVPPNAHFHFDIFASMAGLQYAKELTWMNSGFYTYLVLPEGYDYKKLEAQLPATVDKYIGPQLKQSMGITLQQFRAGGSDIGFSLQRLTDIHLHSDLTGDMKPAGDIRYVYIFSAVALIMLLIAAINFMNLSTAGASKRSKEVGVRKVLGSGRGELVRQFLVESLILTVIATLLALGLVYWSIPFFNQLEGQNIVLHWQTDYMLIPGLILFAVFTGLLAGSYPAFFLSSFRPIAVLKGKLTVGKSSIGLRSGLVIFQFFISISLIVGTIVVYEQLSYIQHKKLGYDRSQVIVLGETYWLGEKQDVFRRELLQDPRVLSVSSSGYLPAGPSNNNNFFATPDINPDQYIKALRYDVDYDYIPTLGMEIKAGRNFSRDFAADSLAVIVNETGAKIFGWGDNALGHTIHHAENGGKRYNYHVIGVVKDFHFRSLHQLITPLVMTMGTPNEGTLIVKAGTKDVHGLLTSMAKKWTALTSAAPFSWSFLDQRFKDTYKAEQNIGYILAIFSGLTIFVACLGLLGLATFTADQRTKEIGIRKVLGATTISIVALLSKDFLKLIIYAFLIAVPVSWIVMNKWLQDFAYRITFSWTIFALTALLAILVTLATIGFRALRAALANPADSLRSE